MKISRKTDYALRALVTLADHYQLGPIPIRELARCNEIPKRFLEQILLELKAERWVESMPGARGGYVLACDPAQIMLGEVVRHFEGNLAPSACTAIWNYKRCSQEPACRFRRVFLDIRNYIAALMDHTSLMDVIRVAPVSSRERLLSREYVGGDGI